MFNAFMAILYIIYLKIYKTTSRYINRTKSCILGGKVFMKLKKVVATGLTVAMAASLAACGGSSNNSASNNNGGSDDQTLSYKNIKLGESYKDVNATIKVLTNRTDMLKDDYKGTTWAQYISKFNEMYPNIKVEVEGITDYSDTALIRLNDSGWGDIMAIPAVDKQDLSKYFLSYGSLSDVEQEVKYVSDKSYDGQAYGIPTTAAARGIVYNKKVFQEAGVTTLPKTPSEFMDALKKIKDAGKAIPLYTNYHAGWTMSAWDDYVGITATGDDTYMNQGIVHDKTPFSDPGDGTHAYNVYKILYDAVANGYTEDDYSTTDWESSKTKINNGEIGCMVLGSWAVTQMQQAGPNADDIGYMPFPITVNGKQYTTAAPDYNFGINCKSSEDNQKAAMVFVKWMTEKSNYSYNEGGLPLVVGDEKYPDTYKEFIDNNVSFVPDQPAKAGEEDLLNEINADSELALTNGGKEKIQAIVEHAANGDESFDDIMNEWNQKWAAAQK